jgi:hypothetical protein
MIKDNKGVAIKKSEWLSEWAAPRNARHPFFVDRRSIGFTPS